MRAEETRVVLVKRGDVLLIGGASLLNDAVHQAVAEFFSAAGIQIMVFEDDISIEVARSEILSLAREQVAPDLAAARRDWQALRERLFAVLEVDPESRPLPTVGAMVESLIRRAIHVSEVQARRLGILPRERRRWWRFGR